jgi:hypothetical protein
VRRTTDWARSAQQREQAGAEHVGQDRPQLLRAHGVAHAEDDPQDDLERHGLHVRQDGEGPAARPALDVRRGDLGDHVAVAAGRPRRETAGSSSLRRRSAGRRRR